jgi:hypothetical protein
VNICGIKTGEDNLPATGNFFPSMPPPEKSDDSWIKKIIPLRKLPGSQKGKGQRLR